MSSPALIVPTNIQPLSPPKPYPIAPLPVNIGQLTKIEVNAAADFQHSKHLFRFRDPVTQCNTVNRHQPLDIIHI